MALCPDTDGSLKKSVKTHTEAQRGVVRRLDARIDEFETELASIGDTNPARQKKLEEAIETLRLEVRGEKRNEAGEWEKIKATGMERLDVMESLYEQREPRLFTYANAAGEERRASLFGMPTLREMADAGHQEAVDEMVVRSISLLESNNSTRNPMDFLDTTGLEVKDPLDRGIEHHHIYNNVVVHGDGSVSPKSVTIRMSKTGEPEIAVVPAYHGYNYQGKDKVADQLDSVQFITLMDAMHSGADPVAHLHYYKFDGGEEEWLKERLVFRGREEVRKAKDRIPKLESEIASLQERRADPKGYQQRMESELDRVTQEREQVKADRKAADKASEEYSQLGDRMNALKKEQDKIKRAIAKHGEQERLTSEIRSNEVKLSEANATKKGLSSKASRIRKKMRDGKPVTPEEEAILKQYEEAKLDSNELREQVKTTKAKLARQGGIDEQIASKERSLRASRTMSELDDDKLVEMFDRSNGFFSFDKGSTEKDAHTKFRPEMNREITKFYVREALQYLEQSGRSLDEIIAAQYQQSLLTRLTSIAERIN